MTFLETSAKEADNVDKLFYDIAIQLTKKAQEEELEQDHNNVFKPDSTTTISNCSTCFKF